MGKGRALTFEVPGKIEGLLVEAMDAARRGRVDAGGSGSRSWGVVPRTAPNLRVERIRRDLW